MRRASQDQRDNGASDDREIGNSWLETMRLGLNARDASVLYGTDTSEIEWCVWSKDWEHSGQAALTPRNQVLAGPVLRIWITSSFSNVGLLPSILALS